MCTLESEIDTVQVRTFIGDVRIVSVICFLLPSTEAYPQLHVVANAGSLGHAVL